MKKLFISLITAILTFSATNSAEALIIDLNAQTNRYNSNPVSIQLTAGDYTVTPIGIADGGMYDAWSYWRSGDKWNHNFNILIGNEGSPDFQEIDTFDNQFYKSPAEALADAPTINFTLNTDNTVHFSIRDNIYYDNRCGLSLNLSDPTPAPEPTSMLLGALGIGGAYIRRKRKA